MSDKYRSLTVVLEEETSEENIKLIQNAIEMVKGVLRVVPEVAESDNYAVKEIVKWKIIREMVTMLKNFE